MSQIEFRRYLKQVFFVPMLALVLLAGCLLWQIHNARTARRWLRHSDQVTMQLEMLDAAVDDQEMGLRDYQLTGDLAMLEPYNSAASRIGFFFEQLHNLISDNPSQLQRLAVLHDRYAAWQRTAHAILSEQKLAVRDASLNARGKEAMDAVRNTSREILAVENSLRRSRFEQSRLEERRTAAAVYFGAPLVGLLLGLFMLNRLHRVYGAFRQSLDELEKKAADLHTRREWLQITLQSIGDAVIACDADGNIDFLNQVAQKLTGWTSEEARGHRLQEVFHIINEETRAVCENPVEKVRRMNTVIGLANHTVLVSKNGKEYVIDDSAAPIRDNAERMIGVVLVFRDVTETRRAEAALIATEKLAVAGRLAASIAHEIHNPLDSVANLHFLIDGESDAAKRAEYLQMAQQELGRTLQISRTMLSLYREPSAPVDLDLRELVESVLLLLERRLAGQQIQVRQELAEAVRIEGFPGELRQVLTNIIVNAAEAAGSRGRILIRLERMSPDEFRGAGALIEVRDSGPGITKGANGNLFQPFFTTKGADGTGLGLWVSLGIVQKHGGTIHLTNSPSPAYPGYPGALVSIFLPTHTLATPARRTSAHIG